MAEVIQHLPGQVETAEVHQAEAAAVAEGTGNLFQKQNTDCNEKIIHYIPGMHHLIPGSVRSIG
jgi:hypothetical protein